MTAAVERMAPALLAVTVVVLACGSSSVDVLSSLGRSGRWPVLFLLAAVAAFLAVRRGSLLDAAREPLHIAAAGFVGLAALSVAWTVDASLTAQRAISLATLLLAAAGLGWAARGRPQVAGRLLMGLLAGAAAVAAAGLAVLGLSFDDAVQATAPLRYRGLGENPNTVSMLVATAMPLALWVTMTTRRGRERAFGLSSVVLFYGTIVFSGSRGALIAAFIGSLGFVLGTAPVLRVRLERVGIATALFVLAVGLAQLPRSLTVVVASGGETPTTTAPSEDPGAGSKTTRTTDGETAPTVTTLAPNSSGSVGRLADEIGRPATGGAAERTFFGSSGRVLGWRSAIAQGNDRPLLGYGFGTEDVVFVDRIYTLQSRRPENSFVGVYLQLGLFGLALLLAILLSAARSGMRSARSLAARSQERPLAFAAAGVVAAGALLALVQSYVYSAGNIASLTVWTSLFILAGAETWSEPQR